MDEAPPFVIQRRIFFFHGSIFLFALCSAWLAVQKAQPYYSHAYDAVMGLDQEMSRDEMVATFLEIPYVSLIEPSPEAKYKAREANLVRLRWPYNKGDYRMYLRFEDDKIQSIFIPRGWGGFWEVPDNPVQGFQELQAEQKVSYGANFLAIYLFTAMLGTLLTIIKDIFRRSVNFAPYILVLVYFELHFRVARFSTYFDFGWWL